MNDAAFVETEAARISGPDRRIAMLLMALFAVLWAVLEDELGVRLRHPYDLTEIVWCRYAAHLLVVGLVWGVRHPTTFWRTSRPGLQFGRSFLMLIMPVSFALAVMQGVAASSVWAVFWSAPLMIVCLARVLSPERVPAWVWVVTIAASLGAIAMVGPRSLPTGMGAVWPLMMAASFALYVVLTRTLRTETLSANLFYTAVGVIIPLSFYVPRIWVMPSRHDAVILFGIGALGFLALLALDRAAERAEVSRTAPFLTLQVVAVLFINWSRQTAQFSLTTLAGALLVVTSLTALWIAGPRVTLAETP